MPTDPNLPAPFVGPCSYGATPYCCACDECGAMYAEEGEQERAAEARNEAALYGATPAMLADYAAEEEREARWVS